MNYSKSVYTYVFYGFFLAQCCLSHELHVKNEETIVFAGLVASKGLHPALNMY